MSGDGRAATTGPADVDVSWAVGWTAVQAETANVNPTASGQWRIFRNPARDDRFMSELLFGSWPGLADRWTEVAGSPGERGMRAPDARRLGWLPGAGRDERRGRRTRVLGPRGAVVAELLLRRPERVTGVLARDEQEAVRAVADDGPGVAAQPVQPALPLAEHGGDDERDGGDRRRRRERPDRDPQAGEPGNHEGHQDPAVGGAHQRLPARGEGPPGRGRQTFGDVREQRGDGRRGRHHGGRSRLPEVLAQFRGDTLDSRGEQRLRLRQLVREPIAEPRVELLPRAAGVAVVDGLLGLRQHHPHPGTEV